LSDTYWRFGHYHNDKTPMNGVKIIGAAAYDDFAEVNRVPGYYMIDAGVGKPVEKFIKSGERQFMSVRVDKADLEGFVQNPLCSTEAVLKVQVYCDKAEAREVNSLLRQLRSKVATLRKELVFSEVVVAEEKEKPGSIRESLALEVEGEADAEGLLSVGYSLFDSVIAEE